MRKNGAWKGRHVVAFCGKGGAFRWSRGESSRGDSREWKEWCLAVVSKVIPLLCPLQSGRESRDGDRSRGVNNKCSCLRELSRKCLASSLCAAWSSVLLYSSIYWQSGEIQNEPTN